MRKIPVRLRNEMDAEPWYHRCAVTGSTFSKIEWHHNLIFAGRQVNEKWCIIPLAEHIHADIIKWKEIIDWIMLGRGSESDLQRYSKSTDLFRRRATLEKKYGVYHPDWITEEHR